MSNEQISLPSLVAVLVVIGLILRYLFSSGGPPANSSRSPEAVRRAREVAAERIQQMFPQAERRSILWDLQRNGGNIQSTTERILAGRLETVSPKYLNPVTVLFCRIMGRFGSANGKKKQPPITFQPPPPPGQPTSSAGGSSSRQQPDKPSQPDLITRYNLSGKIDPTADGSDAAAAADAAAMAAVDRKGKAWSSNRDERQASLQRRRDEMILAARRKMQARMATEKGGQGS
jgi:coupling of ubiquitin conjugation to ER degradation protein 1